MIIPTPPALALAASLTIAGLSSLNDTVAQNKTLFSEVSVPTTTFAALHKPYRLNDSSTAGRWFNDTLQPTLVATPTPPPTTLVTNTALASAASEEALATYSAVMIPVPTVKPSQTTSSPSEPSSNTRSEERPARFLQWPPRPFLFGHGPIVVPQETTQASKPNSTATPQAGPTRASAWPHWPHLPPYAGHGPVIFPLAPVPASKPSSTATPEERQARFLHWPHWPSPGGHGPAVFSTATASSSKPSSTASLEERQGRYLHWPHWPSIAGHGPVVFPSATTSTRTPHRTALPRALARRATEQKRTDGESNWPAMINGKPVDIWGWIEDGLFRTSDAGQAAQDDNFDIAMAEEGISCRWRWFIGMEGGICGPKDWKHGGPEGDSNYHDGLIAEGPYELDKSSGLGSIASIFEDPWDKI